MTVTRPTLRNAARCALGLIFLACGSAQGQAPSNAILNLKNQIVQLAAAYEGQGDPDQSKQKSLEVLVNQLLAIAPMPPVAERIPILAGAWKQVWGPYDYRNDDGGIDPTLGTREIYQVVFPDGYYYNVAPNYPKGDRTRERISLLRGKFKVDKKEPNTLRVKFTNYPGVKNRPAGLDLWDLAPLAESGQLPDRVTIVPTWIVKLFFGGGKLEEVYTDKDLRITYGTSKRPGARRFLYVMSRVEEGPRRGNGGNL